MNRVRRSFLARGVVQGVGFRPFVFREAERLGLGGYVRNRGDAGVEIVAEGPADAVSELERAVKMHAPQLARVDSVAVEDLEPIGETQFRIAPSSEGSGARGAIPPDTAICPECVADVRGTGRYAGYWATSCTNCGPRFTVIEGLPYDRPQTSMDAFPLCAACAAEYADPQDRRYHAQTTACPICGPRLSLDGTPREALTRAADALRRGEIVAVKGIGGTHLACDAARGEPVDALRRRLGRSAQPFALLAREEDVERFAIVTAEEWKLLRCPQRPIVVLRQRPDALPRGIAPGLDSVGVMLPYSGLHVLLLDAVKTPLVMTSANLPGRPMLIENGEIERRLGGIADHVLLHDRHIVARCDDSVVRRAGGRTVFLRRSRGYTPERFPINLGRDALLALGPETGLTFALYGGGAITMSQHVGSVNNLESLEFLRHAIPHLEHLAGTGRARRLACDLHPQFMTSQLARELAEQRGGEVVPVQHHVAHLAATMGERRLEEAVGVVLDGYGYGTDGSAWGGEIFVARDGRVTRVGSLRPVRLPGGDVATRHPLRAAAGYLGAAGVSGAALRAALAERGLSPDRVDAVEVQISQGVNAPRTTSAGRFLDAVAAWIGLCRERTYEGEPAMRLEAAGHGGTPTPVPVRLLDEGGFTHVDLVSGFLDLLEMERRGVSSSDIAATAQDMLATGTASAAIRAAEQRGIGVVCLSGGVAVNDAIASRFTSCVERAGLRAETNGWVPCGDGGVSFGQLIFLGLGWELGAEA